MFEDAKHSKYVQCQEGDQNKHKETNPKVNNAAEKRQALLGYPAPQVCDSVRPAFRFCHKALVLPITLGFLVLAVHFETPRRVRRCVLSRGPPFICLCCFSRPEQKIVLCLVALSNSLTFTMSSFCRPPSLSCVVLVFFSALF